MTSLTKTLIAWQLIFLPGIYYSAYSQSFEPTSDTFVPVYNGNIEWADLDNDGDLDLIYCGFTEGGDADPVKVYRNDAGSFTKVEVSLPAIRNGQFALGDYDGDGDLDVLLAGLLGNDPAISQLYQNDGALNFSLKYSFPGRANPTTSWFDIDNDEDLDFLISGMDDDTDPVETLVYENNGGTFVRLDNTNIPPCLQCSMDWGDANGDGLIDLLVAGFGQGSLPIAGIYVNNGDRTFTLDENANLPAAYNGTAAWGDADMDGDLDIFLCGSPLEGPIFTQIYENKAGSFELFTSVTLPPLVDNYNRGARWVDFDYDGKLDLVVSGRISHIEVGTVLGLYKNIGGPTLFSEVPEANFDGLHSSSIDFGDFDNDGDVDMAYLGFTPSGISTGIFRNTARQSAPTPNTAPDPPAANSLAEIFAFRKDVYLGWGYGFDTQTPTEGLLYNFYIRNATGMIAAPNVDRSTGTLTSRNEPNAHSLITRMTNIPEGELFWAVQSIDGARTGSSFSPERSFYHINGPEALQVEITEDQEVLLSWIDNSEVESSYRVRRATIPDGPYEDASILPPNTTSFVDNHSLATETHYYYRIYASSDQETSPYDSLNVVIPAPPTNLVAKPINASAIVLTWNDNSQFEHGYVLERKLSSEGDFEIIQTLSEDTESVEDIRLPEGTAYSYRIRAINEFGGSAFSNVANVTTKFTPVGLDFSRETVEDVPLLFTAGDFESIFNDRDVDDQLAAVRIISLPTGVTLSLNGEAISIAEVIPSEQLGQLVLLPLRDVNGLKTVKFRVLDATDEATDNSTISISVAPINDPPAFILFSSAELSEDFQGQIKIQPTIRPVPSDETSQRVIYSVTPLASSKVAFQLNENTGELTLSAISNEFGRIELTVTADDGQTENNTYSQEIVVNILPVNDPPVISDIPDMEVEFLESVAPIEFMIEDVDNPAEQITLSATVEVNPLLSQEDISFSGDGNTRTLQIEKELSKPGVAVITVSAFDGIASTSTEFTVTTVNVTATLPTFEKEIAVYPNPFASTLHVDLNEWSAFKPVTLIVLDFFGQEHARKVTSDGFVSIALDELPPGMYLLDITYGETIKRRVKVMKL